MVDISQYTSVIENETSTGNDVRVPIVNALNILNEGVSSANGLRIGNTTYPSSEFVKRTVYEEITNYDTYPVQDSQHAVTSGGLYDIFAAINLLLYSILRDEEE